MLGDDADRLVEGGLNNNTLACNCSYFVQRSLTLIKAEQGTIFFHLRASANQLLIYQRRESAYLRKGNPPEPPQLAATLRVNRQLAKSSRKHSLSQVSLSSPHLFSLPSFWERKLPPKCKAARILHRVTRCESKKTRREQKEQPANKSTSKQKRDSRIFVSWNLLRHRKTQAPP